MFGAFSKKHTGRLETVGDSRGQVFRKLVQKGLDPNQFVIRELSEQKE
jgi:hypothetical protein